MPARWHIPAIPALRKLRQEDYHEFKASVGPQLTNICPALLRVVLPSLPPLRSCNCLSRALCSFSADTPTVQGYSQQKTL